VIILGVIIAVLVYGWWPKRVKTVVPTKTEMQEALMASETEIREYELTLMHPNGEFIGVLTAPGLPRHIYACPGGRGFLSDNPTPPDEDVIAFDRIGSSVHVDDERTALFVRRV
jgi:hypothetical protein